MELQFCCSCQLIKQRWQDEALAKSCFATFKCILYESVSVLNSVPRNIKCRIKYQMLYLDSAGQLAAAGGEIFAGGRLDGCWNVCLANWNVREWPPSLPALYFCYFSPGSHYQGAAFWAKQVPFTDAADRRLTDLVESGGSSCRCINSRWFASMLATVSEGGENMLSVKYNGTFPRICLIYFTYIWGKRGSLGRLSEDLIII